MVVVWELSCAVCFVGGALLVFARLRKRYLTNRRDAKLGEGLRMLIESGAYLEFDGPAPYRVWVDRGKPWKGDTIDEAIGKAADAENT